MLTIDALREYGAAVDEGLKRCMNLEEFYLDLIKTLAADQRTAQLREAVESGDLKGGFELAHALKGMCTNLALDPLSEPVVEITELLRAGTQTDYGPLLDRIDEQKRRLEDICR